MPLTDAERERGAAHYRRNKRNAIGNGGGPQMGDDHPALAAVRDALDELEGGGRRRFKADEVAAGLDHSTKTVAQALAKLRAAGRVEALTNGTPTVWRLAAGGEGGER